MLVTKFITDGLTTKWTFFTEKMKYVTYDQSWTGQQYPFQVLDVEAFHLRKRIQNSCGITNSKDFIIL